jgi:hypothetical protein
MLRSISKDVWAHEADLRMPGGVPMPCRATLMSLPGGSLALHSPLAIDDATAKEVDAIGEVRFLIAPNCLHWMYLRRAKERYPGARVVGAPGLEKKLSGLAFEPLPASGVVEGIEGLRVQRIEGASRMGEHAFFHQASRSLVVTDLVFNIHGSPSFRLRLYLRLIRAYRRTAQSLVWRMLVNDRAAAASSASTLLTWDFDRLIMAHGDVLEANARERTRKALSWMTARVPALLPSGATESLIEDDADDARCEQHLRLGGRSNGPRPTLRMDLRPGRRLVEEEPAPERLRLRQRIVEVADRIRRTC